MSIAVSIIIAGCVSRVKWLCPLGRGTALQEVSDWVAGLLGSCTIDLMDIFDGDQFTARIRLGNSEMQTPEDVARALREVADCLEGSGLSSHGILDVNGNRVGEWSVI